MLDRDLGKGLHPLVDADVITYQCPNLKGDSTIVEVKTCMRNYTPSFYMNAIPYSWYDPYTDLAKPNQKERPQQ